MTNNLPHARPTPPPDDLGQPLYGATLVALLRERARQRVQRWQAGSEQEPTLRCDCE